MTRMIERWFPCAEVSAASGRGWGSGRTENALFVWFAARPIAQAKAAVVTSLLPWPDDEAEQRRLKEMVQESMEGRYAASEALRAELRKHYPSGSTVLDPFSGRGTIPLEAARLGELGLGVDLSPLAALGSQLLTDYPFRDWSGEPELPFASHNLLAGDRLMTDVEGVLEEIHKRHVSSMSKHYQRNSDGSFPWGYLWSVTVPCSECGNRFPLFGSNQLRLPAARPKGGASLTDAGQSFYVNADPGTGEWEVVVHDGLPVRPPTLLATAKADGRKGRGKAAICPFCDNAMPLTVHTRLLQERKGEDALLVVADLDAEVGKIYRAASLEERTIASETSADLLREAPFSPLLPAVPDELIPANNGATIRPQQYGARTYGDLCVPRQTLSLVRLSRTISEISLELVEKHGLSREYAQALTGYAAAVLAKVLRYSTRGARLYVKNQQVDHIFANEGTLNFSPDSFETGIDRGPGTWTSIMASELAALRVVTSAEGRPATITRGTATTLPLPSKSVNAVVTDPPYDAMVYYSDLSDLFYCWLKRALFASRPDLVVTDDPAGLQPKKNEIIVKEHGKAPGEHRTREHYDRSIALAFSEMKRVVEDEGIVTIVFGHGEPEVWHRLLVAIHGGGLVLTASWPARTESGSRQNKANIETTLTMACRPAPTERPIGRAAAVEAEVKAEVTRRVSDWGRAGLAPTDMLMASAGPAMEVVGRYSKVVNNRGDEIAPDRYLIVARKAVQDAEAIEIDHHPLDTFDARTRFALWWVRLYKKQVAAKSELRWQTLASDMDAHAVRDLVPDVTKGSQFVSAKNFKSVISADSPVIDVALAMARSWPEGIDAVGEVLTAAGRQEDDSFLWAAISFLADRFPDADPDAIAWTGMLRARNGVIASARGVGAARRAREAVEAASNSQPTLFDGFEERER